MSSTHSEKKTIREIARIAGVSSATVTRAFETPLRSGISEATRNRVLEVAAKMGYQPKSAAKRLVQAQTGVPNLGRIKTPQAEKKTIREVARLAGVSRATITRAFETPLRPGISEETRKRVMEAAAKLGYQPNPAAQRLKMGKSHTVCIPSLGSIAQPTGAGPVTLQFSDMYAGAISALMPNGYRLEPIFFNNREEAARLLPMMYRAGYFDGVLVHAYSISLDCAKELASAGCIVVTRLYTEEGVPNLHKIDVPCASSIPLIQELLNQGRQRFVFIYGIHVDVAQAYASDLQLGRLHFSSIPPFSYDWREDPARVVEDVFAADPEVDAIVSDDEFVGWAIFKELLKRGIDVPGHITIAGIGDVRHPFKPLPVLQLLYAPNSMWMRTLAGRFLEVMAAENPSISLPKPYTVPTAPVVVLPKNEFQMAAARELRNEKLLAEVEAELLGPGKT